MQPEILQTSGHAYSLMDNGILDVMWNVWLQVRMKLRDARVRVRELQSGGASASAGPPAQVRSILSSEISQFEWSFHPKGWMSVSISLGWWQGLSGFKHGHHVGNAEYWKASSA